MLYGEYFVEAGVIPNTTIVQPNDVRPNQYIALRRHRGQGGEGEQGGDYGFHMEARSAV